MTFKERIEEKKEETELTNWYTPPEITIPHCVLHRGGSRSILGEDNITSNALAYNEKISNKIAMSLCYDA